MNQLGAGGMRMAQDVLDRTRDSLGLKEAIPFHRPRRSANELAYVTQALELPHRQGGGQFTKACHDKLTDMVGAPTLLTQSCTAALEFAASLIGIEPGDEVVLPSYTFTSTATAFAIRGARLAFVDIDPGTQNIDPQWIEAALTERTKAIVIMHYAGVSCDMPAIEAIARRHNLPIIEDAAQAVGATAADGRPLGAIGAIGALSFHDTKNISSGEGGAVILGEAGMHGRAEIMWEKGTDRSKFLRKEVDKYTWIDIGSSFLPSEITAAMLLAQLEELNAVTAARLQIWSRYHEAFAELERSERVSRPRLAPGARHNAHLYYLMLPSSGARDSFMSQMNAQGVGVAFHYVPLHDSPAGKRFGRAASPMVNTQRAGEGLVRLPLWPDMTSQQVDRVVETVFSHFGSAA